MSCRLSDQMTQEFEEKQTNVHHRHLAEGMTHGVPRDDQQPVKDVVESPGMHSADELHLRLMKHVTDEHGKVGRLAPEHRAGHDGVVIIDHRYGSTSSCGSWAGCDTISGSDGGRSRP